MAKPKTIHRTGARASLAAILCILSPWLMAEGSSEKQPLTEYLELKPSFVTNYGGPGPIHFLKADITLRLAKDEQSVPQVNHHMPYLRHELVMLLSRQTDESLASVEGKEKLRSEALAAVQKALQTETGKPLVDDLLFTNFVVQQ